MCVNNHLNLKEFNKSSIAAVIICITAFILWTILLFQKYYYFGYGDWDLAFFSQAVWNITNNNSQFSSLFGINFFSNHSNFFAYFCIPLFKIFGHPMTLVLLKVFSYVSAAYLLFLLGKEKIGGTLAILCMVLYLIYPPNIFAIAYDFHFESVSPFFLVYLYYCFTKEKYLHFLITAILTISIKENMPLIIATFGIYGFVTKKGERFKWGIIPIALGFMSFYLLTSVIIPYLNGGNVHNYIGYFKDYGDTPTDVLKSIIKNPFQLIPVFTTPQNINYFREYFSSLLFVPLFNLNIIFLCLPLMLQHLLSSSFQPHTIYYHYSISIAPFIFIALINSLSTLKSIIRKPAFITIIFLMTILSILNLNSHKDRIQSRLSYHKDYLHKYRQEFVKEIPKNASVIASFDFLAPLSMREHLYAFYKIYYTIFQNSDKFLETLNKVNYAIIDFKNPWILNTFQLSPKKTSFRIQNFLNQNNWNFKKSAENIVFLTKNSEERKIQLVTQSQSPFKEFSPKQILSIDQKFDLLTVDFQKKITQNSSIPLVFYWRSNQQINTLYQILLRIKKEGTIVHKTRHNIGYLIYPTLTWGGGIYTKEIYSIVIPKITSGKYTLDIQFIDTKNKKIAGLKHPNSKLITNNTFILKNFTIK